MTNGGRAQSFQPGNAAGRLWFYDDERLPVMLLGLVLIVVSATYAVRHPKAKDEPFSAGESQVLVVAPLT